MNIYEKVEYLEMKGWKFDEECGCTMPSKRKRYYDRNGRIGHLVDYCYTLQMDAEQKNAG